MVNIAIFNMQLILLIAINHVRKKAKGKYILEIEIDVKGTVSVISSDPSCKDGNARYTIVALKALYDQV